MYGAILPLPSTPSWRGAELREAQGQLYLYLYDVSELVVVHPSILFSPEYITGIGIIDTSW
jgi:hypothetical protein